MARVGPQRQGGGEEAMIEVNEQRKRTNVIAFTFSFIPLCYKFK